MKVENCAATFVVVAALLTSGSALAADGLGDQAGGSPPQPDKSGYHFFHPTPRAQMREMATDRPDTTESPISVDAGHAQLETEIVTLATDEGVDDLTLGSFNLKLGIASWMDLQVIFGVFHRVERVNSIDDLAFRTKFNLWGNDGGPTAFALMPFVTIPTTGPMFVEGGLIAPLGIEGPAGWEFATMLELDVVRRTRAYGLDIVGTVTAGHNLWKGLGGFVEVAGIFPTAEEHVDLAANGGLTLALSDDIMLDGGVRVGLTPAAQDIGGFLGGSGRY
jgi:Putative MetA-pathway of phenol degradation